MRRTSRNAGFATKLMVANGIVMSKLVYLITLWGGAQQYLLKSLLVQLCVDFNALAGLRKGYLTRLVGSQSGSWSSSILCYRHTNQFLQEYHNHCILHFPLSIPTELDKQAVAILDSEKATKVVLPVSSTGQ